MTMRVCSVAGCPELIPQAGRCATHAREYEQARGTSTARGYGSAHQRERATWAPAVERGGIPCRRCRLPILPGTPWDLGHPDADCARPIAPEHAACNRATTGR